MGPFKVKFEANLQGIFLSDPSPIIVYPCHSLTPVLLDLIEVTLACEDARVA